MSAAHHAVHLCQPCRPSAPRLLPGPYYGLGLPSVPCYTLTMLRSYQVPAMRPEFCTKRMICMEYCPGVKISDTDELERQGFDQALPTMLPT